jgi:hypothetical protein
MGSLFIVAIDKIKMHVILFYEYPKESLKLSLPGSCQNPIGILEFNFVDFGQSRVTGWSEVDANSVKVAHWAAGSVCQILKIKKLN